MTNDQVERLIKAIESVAVELSGVNDKLDNINSLLDYIEKSVSTL